MPRTIVVHSRIEARHQAVLEAEGQNRQSYPNGHLVEEQTKAFSHLLSLVAKLGRFQALRRGGARLELRR